MSQGKPNRLINEKSPYLLQHAYNPVDWYPWGEEAFEKALREDKPVFLSIGYSACHWCHVMESECFEDEAVANALNASFVSIKVDREERPDIDNVYMRVCQAFTGGGGWPTSIFMTARQKPFFAGTYFPKAAFLNLLSSVSKKWSADKASLLGKSEAVSAAFDFNEQAGEASCENLISEAVLELKRTFDMKYGGFGHAPKFPTPHILFLLINKEPALAEKTLIQMYRGGIFDHVGYGFSRYSTDRLWLVPHFEKMLYDNALLSLAYVLAYEATGKQLYGSVAEKIFLYMERELQSPEGGFFSSQDADSDGEEGKYYVFTPHELITLLGQKDGARFNEYFGITERGNFGGGSIPNLIDTETFDPSISKLLPAVYEYREKRASLRTDSKILTGWNALAAAAYAAAYRVFGAEKYLETALRTADFIERELTDGDTVYSCITDGRRGTVGYLDDYAFYIFALICLNQATHDEKYLKRAERLLDKAVSEYFDYDNGGFFFSGTDNENLIFNPKETYDGAIPSGNSVMAYNLSRLAALTRSDELYGVLRRHCEFMNSAAGRYPAGNCFYLYSMLPTKEVVCVPKDMADLKKLKIKSDWIFSVSNDSDHQMINGGTTFYVCRGGACLPPSNEAPV